MILKTEIILIPSQDKWMTSNIILFYFKFDLSSLLLPSSLSAPTDVNCVYWSVLLLSIDFPGSGREENTGGFQSDPVSGPGVRSDCDVPQQNCNNWTGNISDSQPDIGAKPQVDT